MLKLPTVQVRISIPLTLWLCSALLACRPAVGTASPTPSGPAPTVTVPIELPTTIAFAGHFGLADLQFMDAQVAAFEADQPDSWVEIVRLDRLSDRRLEQVTSRLRKKDVSVDLYLLDSTWPSRLAGMGGLASLEEVEATKQWAAGAFLPGTLEANTVDGSLKALPLSADGGLLYYRRDLLEKYGYEPPKSWPDLQKMATDIQRREESPAGIVWPGIDGETLTCVALEFVWAFGGDLLSPDGQVVFDSLETRAALQQMLDLQTSGVAPDDIALYDETRALQEFKEQEVPFLRGWFSSWDAVNAGDSPVAGKVGVAPLPASCVAGQSLGLSSYSLHPSKAGRLMEFLTGYEQQVEMALSSLQPPVLQSAYQDDRLKERVPILGEVGAGLAAGRARPAVVEYPQISEAISSTVHRMLLGELEVEETARHIQAQLEEIMGQ